MGLRLGGWAAGRLGGREWWLSAHLPRARPHTQLPLPRVDVSVGIAAGAFPAAVPFCPLPLVHQPVAIRERPHPMLQVLLPLSVVALAAPRHQLPAATAHVLMPIPSVDVAVAVHLDPIAQPLPFTPGPLVGFATFRGGQCALHVVLPVAPIASILRPVRV